MRIGSQIQASSMNSFTLTCKGMWVANGFLFSIKLALECLIIFMRRSRPTETNKRYCWMTFLNKCFLSAFLFLFSNGVTCAQDSLRLYSFGIGSEFKTFDYNNPFSLEFNYTPRACYFNFFTSFRPYQSKEKNTVKDEVRKENNTRISILAGTRIGKKKNKIEVGAGYTLLISSFDRYQYVYSSYFAKQKGNHLGHYLNLQAGYRFIVCSVLSVKPEFCINYIAGEKIDFEANDLIIFGSGAPVDFNSDFSPFKLSFKLSVMYHFNLK